MNSLVKVFSNFKEFYNEINGATLTGAIDVIVVEQPDGEFQCSPFHVRFGKLGVLRSREKVVDIEINGEPVDIHMKLGESGEAFFVEECPEEDVEELPDNLATSPIPLNHFPEKYLNTNNVEKKEEKEKIASDELQLPLPLPRRNSIDFSNESAKANEVSDKYENQISDYSHRRHTDNTLERPNLNKKINEYTTQKLRQEWAEHEEIFQFETIDKDKDFSNSTQSEDKPLEFVAKEDPTLQEINQTNQTCKVDIIVTNDTIEDANTPLISVTTTGNQQQILVEQMYSNNNNPKEESKSKKKRRKKSQMKKKNAQRKSSSSSSLGSSTPQDGVAANEESKQGEDADTSSISISNNTTNSSNDEASPKSGEQVSIGLVTAMGGDESPISETCQTSPVTPNPRIPDLDIHFFSDTEVTSSGGNGPLGVCRGVGRPSTPIQSDSELEISLREKETDSDLITNSASWKWGELPTTELKDQADNQAAQAQAKRNSMLSSMFNFMKTNNKLRKYVNEGGVYLSDLDTENMDPEMLAMYFPTVSSKEASPAVQALPCNEDDRESGNGTSLPHSPSSLEGQKSLDSDYEDGKLQDGKYLDFVAMSLCGLQEKGDPSDEEFELHSIKYKDVCENPSIFSSPNLVVRLNGKYYSWAAACPIVMTIITFQKPLTNDAVDQLMVNGKQDAVVSVTGDNKGEVDGSSPGTQIQSKRSWWYWRRSQNVNNTANVASNLSKTAKLDEKQEDKENDQNAVATQTTRPNSPDVSDHTLSKTDSTMNAENTSAIMDNMEDLSQSSSKTESAESKNKLERFKKSLRLSSELIKKLNLKEGMNEIEFSVTTAYQGTTRCKCYLFRWKHNDKVVISDIDGTITKSDVLGHILPMVGKDWAQLGVAELFSKIEQNGYKLLYLSARAIGQSRATREYLRSIRQGDVKLPDGPLLLNPTSLISAFHREVIERKPEQFKIACLSDIRDLFPNKDPFYAGYGNRINDVWAYRAVGIPIKRIFTINTKGELKHELTQTFQSSYCSMTFIADQMFPPIKPDEVTAVEFSHFNYWRDPIPEIDLNLFDTINTTTGLSSTTNGNGIGSGNGLSDQANNTSNGSYSKTLTTIPEN